MQRGGTNIIWEILQSHPLVCSPLYETGELISSKSYYMSLPKRLTLFIHDLINHLFHFFLKWLVY